ncbi:hypothetical protein EYF80_012823 [Liparis tanakae]|uniref:Uncharacterized protein n=1 Tax=Liparis tanakae TaxID=230148 RepID=A0A4Z2IGP7_9TELE|nr:hypothetical protein EYF80_012823 [Liparis tanakae]
MSSGFATQHLLWHTKLEQQAPSQYAPSTFSTYHYGGSIKLFLWVCHNEKGTGEEEEEEEEEEDANAGSRSTCFQCIQNGSPCFHGLRLLFKAIHPVRLGFSVTGGGHLPSLLPAGAGAPAPHGVNRHDEVPRSNTVPGLSC